MKSLKKGNLRFILITIIAFQFFLLMIISQWSFSKIEAYLTGEAQRSLSGLVERSLENNKRWSQNLLEAISSSYIKDNFKDRSELYDYSYPVLNRLSKDGLSILNYYTPDGKLYLKTTDPKDTQIESREIPLIANKEDKVIFGVDEEKGVVYSFIAAPIYSKGIKIGVIELGIKTKQLLNELKAVLDADAGILLGKEVVDATDGVVKEAAGKSDFRKDGRYFGVYPSNINEKKGISVIAVKDASSLDRIFFRSRLLIVTLGLISVVAFSISIVKALNPLSNIINTMKEMEGGDLRKKIDASSIREVRDIASGINGFTQSLHTIIKRIQEVAESVVTVSGRIKTNTEKLSSGAKAQGDSTKVTSAAIDQMNVSIKNVADSAKSLSQLADESSASVMEMTAVNNQIDQGTDTLSRLVDDASSAISKMTVTIKQIGENVDVLFSSAEVTSSAVSEIAITVEGIEKSINESTRLSENVKKDASEFGMMAIDKTINGMKKIKDSVEATGLIVNRLGERSQQIGKVLTVIDDVTDQTNLLALNAAIIAAQAGEQGKGFAVVADEIKDLAERTMASTKEIAQMIEAIQKEVEGAILSMKESAESVAEGMNLSRDAGGALDKILESAGKSAIMAKEIKKATEEQARGFVQVNEAVQRITNMVRQIAQATQDQRRGSEQIIGSVEKMKDVSRQVRQATVEQTKGSKHINDAVVNVNQKVHAIAKAIEEQSIGSEQIVASVEEIENITQENINSFSDIKESIDYLIKQADLLKGEASRFVI